MCKECYRFLCSAYETQRASDTDIHKHTDRQAHIEINKLAERQKEMWTHIQTKMVEKADSTYRSAGALGRVKTDTPLKLHKPTMAIGYSLRMCVRHVDSTNPVTLYLGQTR